MSSSGEGKRRAAEPATPSQPRKVTGIRLDPDGTVWITLAPALGDPVSYAPPEEKQDDVIEPTTVYKPWLPSTDWDNVEITAEYHD